MSRRGVEGTVLGTLFMPYFSGLGNLIFVAVVLEREGPAEEIAINAWTNNLTNLCLLLALPAVIWGLNLAAASHAKKAQRESRLHRLSLALTLVALIFFNLTVWVLGQDGEIEAIDTTGAGDAFHGAFALGLAQSMNLRENLRRASAAAALTCLKPGTRNALPEQARVNSLCGVF